MVGAALSCDKKMRGKRTRAATRISRLLRWRVRCQPTRLNRPIREFESCSKHVRSAFRWMRNSTGLAHRLARPESEARALIEHHRNQFPEFWSWVDRVVSTIEFKKSLCTSSGWRVLRRGRDFPAKWRRSAQNWLIQSTSGLAEIVLLLGHRALDFALCTDSRCNPCRGFE